MPDSNTLNLFEEFRFQRDEFERLGKNAPRIKARPANSYLARNGETCRTCNHAVRGDGASTFHKCLLNKSRWTCSNKTDIRLKDAACNLWEQETTED